MTKKHFVGLVFLAFLSGWLGSLMARHPMSGESVVAKETVFTRVMRTQTLRCGYILYDFVVNKDPNTGAMSGILVDALTEMTKRLGWKLEWTEELSYTTGFEGLKTGRYDAVCTALWGFPETAKLTEFVGPLFYEPIGLWVRVDDHRFDQDWDKINDPTISISGVDGTFPALEAKALYPKAKLTALPQLSPYAAPLMDVATGKADVTFITNSMGLAFNRMNGNKLRNIGATPPFRIFPIYLAVQKGAFELQTLLSSVLNLMQNDQTMDKIIRSYEKDPGSFYRVAKPYQQTE
ncbi:MAG: transporter substrate-binding domain-containing protein [Alphaproteobacteria bacterium]|nr:transporter substrate-binding domain-containing protein [Alphaproteobacteria bacterium]